MVARRDTDSLTRKEAFVDRCPSRCGLDCSYGDGCVCAAEPIYLVDVEENRKYRRIVIIIIIIIIIIIVELF